MTIASRSAARDLPPSPAQSARRSSSLRRRTGLAPMRSTRMRAAAGSSAKAELLGLADQQARHLARLRRLELVDLAFRRLDRLDQLGRRLGTSDQDHGQIRGQGVEGRRDRLVLLVAPAVHPVGEQIAPRLGQRHRRDRQRAAPRDRARPAPHWPRRPRAQRRRHRLRPGPAAVPWSHRSSPGQCRQSDRAREARRPSRPSLVTGPARFSVPTRVAVTTTRPWGRAVSVGVIIRHLFGFLRRRFRFVSRSFGLAGGQWAGAFGGRRFARRSGDFRTSGLRGCRRGRWRTLALWLRGPGDGCRSRGRPFELLRVAELRICSDP